MQISPVEPTIPDFAPTENFDPEDIEEILPDDEQTFVEILAADNKTVAARKKASAFAAAFSAVMRRSGVIEACAKLKIDANEIQRLYLTMIDAAQRTEYFAEASGAPCSKNRRFKASGYTMEIFYKRESMPLNLDEADGERWRQSRARMWRRRCARIHELQRHLHLAFFDYEKGTAGSKKKVAGHYTDNLTDLLIDTAQRAAKLKGEPVGRYNRAADEALATFRETVAPYAPEWTPDMPKAKNKPKTETPKKEPDPWKSIKNAATQCVKEALRVAREQGWSEDESFAKRLELQTLIETVWTDAPPLSTPPAEQPTARPPSPSPPPVLVNADTPKIEPVPTPSEGDLDRTLVSYLNDDESADLLGKTPISIEEAAHFSAVPEGQAAQLPDSPEGQAMLAVEAFESVGCNDLKAVLLGIYPLVGEAERLGCEPTQRGKSLTIAEFKSRIPEYIRRNEEAHHNVAVRAWGPIIQVDDCSAEVFERLKPFAFYAEETSPGNSQTWLALPMSFASVDGGINKINKEGKAIRERLLKKFEKNGEAANGGAYGSTRLPGTLNIKEKYRPSFPRIQITHIAKGRVVTPEELEAAGLLATAPIRSAPTVIESPRFSNSKLSTEWPDYQYYVNRSPLKEDGQPNLSRADESFVVRCYALGHSRHSIAAKLRSVRDKAARRDDYVERTLDAAESYLASQPARQQGRVRMTI